MNMKGHTLVVSRVLFKLVKICVSHVSVLLLCWSMLQPNPFGAARPREQVIAEREGKNERDVLKEQANRYWKLQVQSLYNHLQLHQFYTVTCISEAHLVIFTLS